MKFLVLLFLVGFASASFYDALDDAADEIVSDFLIGMENAPSLKEALQLSDIQAADEVEDEIKTELGKKLRETLDHLLEKIKETLDHGKRVKDDVMEKLKEVREKLKDLHLELGDKAKELLNKIKEKAKDFFKKLLDKLVGGGDDDAKRSVNELDEALAVFNLRELLERLKKAILEKIDKEALKEKIEKLFGKGSELADQMLNILKEKGEKAKQKLLDLVDRILGDDEDSRKRSVADVWQKIKDYFDNFMIELKEKHMKFGEWVKEVAGKGLDTAKSKMENLKQIAREVIDHAKELKKDIAAQALDALHPYKEDLGTLYEELKKSVKEIFGRKE